MPAVRPLGLLDPIDHLSPPDIEWVFPVQNGRTSSATNSKTLGITDSPTTAPPHSGRPGGDAPRKAVRVLSGSLGAAVWRRVDGHGSRYGEEFSGDAWRGEDHPALLVPTDFEIDQFAELLGASRARPGRAAGGRRPDQMEVGS